jgi:hypothetical protein
LSRPRERDGSARGRRREFPRLEPLEDRRLLSWPGVPPATIPVPSIATAVTLNAHNDASGSAAIVADESDYSTFIAPSSGRYVLATMTPNSGLDTVLGLFDHSGQRLAFNDDFGQSPDSRLTATLQAGRRYYFGITNYTRTPGGAYAWSVNGPDDDVYEENDTFDTARWLGTLDGAARTYQGLQLRDNDWYRFAIARDSLSPSDFARIEFRHAQGNLDLQLYDRTGRLVRASRGVTDSETVSLAGLAAGTYYLRVYGAAGARNPDYSMTIDAPDDAYEPNDSLAKAKDLGVITSAKSLQRLQLLDDDWFRFTPVVDVLIN